MHKTTAEKRSLNSMKFDSPALGVFKMRIQSLTPLFKNYTKNLKIVHENLWNRSVFYAIFDRGFSNEYKYSFTLKVR